MSDWIERLGLNSHIEGGYFSVFYKSDNRVTVKHVGQELVDRAAGSSIYFLLEKRGYSAWHRLKSDELWHYYDGGSAVD